MKRLIALLLVIFAVPQLAHATAQMPDKLLLDGEEVTHNGLVTVDRARLWDVPSVRPRLVGHGLIVG